MGQSNANPFRCAWDIRSGAQMHNRGVDATSLGVSPYDWGPDDPHGWRAEAATALSSHIITPDQCCVYWFQGENDAIGHSSTYADDLEALILNMDTRFGRSDVFWAIIQLNNEYWLQGGQCTQADNDAIRAAQQAVAAAYPTRIALIDVDDLDPWVPTDNHYSRTDYVTIWGRVMAACATHFSEASWNP